MSQRHQIQAAVSDSPAGKVMDEAIELAIAEESPYPEQAFFLDAHTPHAEREMERAARDGSSVVLVSPDGEIQIIAPEEILGGQPVPDAPDALNPTRRPGR